MSSSGDGTAAAHPAAQERGQGTPGNRHLLRRTVAVVVLLAVAVMPAYLVVLAYHTNPAGPWDHDKVSYSAITSWLALAATGVLALLARALTSPQRADGGLARWWQVLPLLLALATVARLTVLAPSV